MEFFLLIIGLFMLIKGADIFVDGASSVAARLGVPPLIIGLTVVSFGTSAPEAAISISASLGGGSAISLGNVIGSNLFNLLMVIGITSLIIPLTAEGELVRRDMPINILSAGALAISMIDGEIDRYEAFFMLAALVAYMITVIKNAIKNPVESEEKPRLSRLFGIIYILGGLAAVVLGGDIVVDNAKEIAARLGMSETLIGLTVVAFGTSLPELVTSIMAARKGEAGIAVGNAIGSCLFNILFILGVTGIIKPLPAESELITDVCFLAAASVIVYIFAARNKRIGRPDGALLVALYGIYTVFIIARSYGVF